MNILVDTYNHVRDIHIGLSVGASSPLPPPQSSAPSTPPNRRPRSPLPPTPPQIIGILIINAPVN